MEKIKDVKVHMSRIGVHTASYNSVVYVPAVDISYMDPSKKKFSSFAPISDGNRGLKKKDYHGSIVCGDFFVLLFTNEWEIISSDNKLLCAMKPCGTPIQADENDFIVREGNIITGFDKNGKIIGSRELTADEIEYLDKIMKK